jgi:hypothetical protein
LYRSCLQFPPAVTSLRILPSVSSINNASKQPAVNFQVQKTRKMFVTLGTALLCVALSAATKCDECSVSLPKQTASTSVKLTAQRNDTGFWTTQFGEHQVGNTVTACAQAHCAATENSERCTVVDRLEIGLVTLKCARAVSKYENTARIADRKM